MGIELAMELVRQVAEVSGEQELILNFAGGTGRDPAQLNKISRPVRCNERSHRGFNLFHGDDLDLFVAIARGEHRISSFRNRDLQRPLDRNGSQVSRLLKQLHVRGLIKKIGRAYKYYLTRLGRSVVARALRLREETVVPALANS